jgi:hypothetical protein
MKIRIGIDVGKKGGIVAIVTTPENIKYISTFRTPLVNEEIDLNELQRILSVTTTGHTDKLIAIEAVSSVFNSSAKSNFQFGRALGLLEGLVAGMNIPFVKIHAKKWQKVFFEGIPVTFKGDKVDTKAMALQAAKRLYPAVNLLATERSRVPHEGIVDSLGIAHYINLYH